jgi:diguanylate cyclase (GGDEF)-like protein/putative nucleotidyltransferase with HDIG domain
MYKILKTPSGGSVRARTNLLPDVQKAEGNKHDSSLPKQAVVFILLTASLGLSILASGIAHWQLSDPLRFVCYLSVAVFASGLKVTLPGVDGTMSVNFLFILISICELSFSETLLIGCGSSLVQCLWKVKHRPSPVKVIFNVFSMMAPAIALSYYTYHWLAPLLHNRVPMLLISAACAYFLSNTIPVATMISLTEGKPFRKVWSECYFWSFPYYLVGAAIAGLVTAVNSYVGWEMSWLVLPIMYWIYRSYRLYLGRLEDEKRHVEDEKRRVEDEKHHVEEMAGLHLRTIEALALAIGAKDHTTHDHLQRVRVYAMEVAKELGLEEDKIEALRAAALLHDIGKLAVPEYIINKPGHLTPEEFEKMKIHPVVGAEILTHVGFPYPVVPIVRSHHEKWNGSGYPDGLRGEEIPIGARILAAVDCLDALASDRQYRRALPVEQAMEHVARASGTEFDPRVVAVLQRRYIELERMAQCSSTEETQAWLSTGIKVGRGVEPAAGYERFAPSVPATDHESFITSIANARQEAQTLFELSQDLTSSLSLDEILSLLSVRLKKLVPFDSVAIYICRGNNLLPQYVSGDNFRLFSALEIPMGQGLSGWVAQNCKPIVNGNPSVEPGYLNDESKFSTLRSALAVPLEGISGVVGVLALYQAECNAFTTDHLRVLLAIASKLGICIDNALRYQQAETSATTDYLTGLPNARSLFLHLDRELVRCKRSQTTLAVMVCDLDGFKHINDRFGHLQGNKVLRNFADLMKTTCREYDYVARMGGDEFVIIAPGLTPKAAEEKATHLLSLASSAARPVCGQQFLSLSVGAAFYPESGCEAEQLLSEADRKMYIVKQAHHERAATDLSFVDPAALKMGTTE